MAGATFTIPLNGIYESTVRLIVDARADFVIVACASLKKILPHRVGAQFGNRSKWLCEGNSCCWVSGDTKRGEPSWSAFLVETRFSRSLCAVESVFLAVAGSAGALHHKVEEFRVICLADDEGVRFSRFSRAKCCELIGKAVEDRMILNFYVDFHPFGPFLEVLDGVDELLHLAGVTLSDESSTYHAGDVRLAVILHRDDEAERAGCVSGNENRRHALIAKGDRD